MTWQRSYSPDKLYYIGDYAGSLPETKALMRFLYYYIAVEKASVLVDWHQQGGIAYAGKDWCPSRMDEGCANLAKAVFKPMNEGNDYKYYKYEEESHSYGVQGTGSTLTDFACAVAWGAKFSPHYGFCVYEIDGKEVPLISLYKRSGNEGIVCENPDFIEMCFEIGPGRQYLGYSKNTRVLLSKEYDNYRFGKVPYYISDYFVSLNE